MLISFIAVEKRIVSTQRINMNCIQITSYLNLYYLNHSKIGKLYLNYEMKFNQTFSQSELAFISRGVRLVWWIEWNISALARLNSINSHSFLFHWCWRPKEEEKEWS